MNFESIEFILCIICTKSDRRGNQPVLFRVIWHRLSVSYQWIFHQLFQDNKCNCGGLWYGLYHLCNLRCSSDYPELHDLYSWIHSKEHSGRAVFWYFPLFFLEWSIYRFPLFYCSAKQRYEGFYLEVSPAKKKFLTLSSLFMHEFFT